jgi:hypothetical protein
MKNNERTRRPLLIGAAGIAAMPLLSEMQSSPAQSAAQDDALLDDLSHRSFRYFWEQSDPKTGIARGRARFDGSPYPAERRDVGSTGDTGFSLTAMCIGAERKWVTREQARERVLATLRAYANGPVANEHGGSVATFKQRHNERHDVGVSSDCNLEQPRDEMELANSLTDATHLTCPLRIACTAS